MKKTLKQKINFLIHKPLPIIKGTVLFKSFGGQYNDNPKYISEKLHELEPSIQIVWALSDKCKTTNLPNYIKRVNLGSKEYIRYECCSQVVVDNMNGIRGFLADKPALFLHSLFTSRRQLNISTWHGTPLKHIGLDIPGKEKYKYTYTSSDYISAGCQYTMEIFKSAFFPTQIIMNGSPRNDILINCQIEEQENLKKKLNIPNGKKIILFAPTFRDSVFESGIHQMQELNICRLLNILKCVFGGEWCFVFRVHHEVLKAIKISQLRGAIGDDCIIDGNEYDDMAEYLAVADVLLTDYSSSMFDYALTGRPCFLLTLDRKHYIEAERGLYMNMDHLPYKCADSCEELYQNIQYYDVQTSKEETMQFLGMIGNSEDGKASERIAREIITFIRTGKKDAII